MFIVSLNKKRFILIAAAAVAAAIIVTACVIVFRTHAQTPPDTITPEGSDTVSAIARTPEEEQSFLRSFGIKPKPDSRRSENVMIPREFSDAYEEYNKLQRKTGFDLSRYRGQTAAKVTYDTGKMSAVLLIINGRVAGAHLSSGIQGEAYKAINYGKTR